VISKPRFHNLLEINPLQKTLFGRLSRSRTAQQKQRWFGRGQGWRAGIEARLSTLKHRIGIHRAFLRMRSVLKETLAGASSLIILWQ
jgi:hypothetical protein